MGKANVPLPRFASVPVRCTAQSHLHNQEEEERETELVVRCVEVTTAFHSDGSNSKEECDKDEQERSHLHSSMDWEPGEHRTTIASDKDCQRSDKHPSDYHEDLEGGGGTKSG